MLTHVNAGGGDVRYSHPIESDEGHIQMAREFTVLTIVCGVTLGLGVGCFATMVDSSFGLAGTVAGLASGLPAAVMWQRRRRGALPHKHGANGWAAQRS